jgi:hypothetical protein
MIYFKTYFYAPYEVPFLILNLRESYKYIDKFVICEFNYTHTGIKRDYIWEQHKHKFPVELMDKVVYLKIDMSKVAKYAYNNEPVIHSVNEPYMRGSFTKYLKLQDNDIIISTDADEIIYGEKYPDLLKTVRQKGAICLTLYQFFYRVNYLWKNKPFRAPTIALYKRLKRPFPNQWRYQGENYPGLVGCHFSWCMTVDEMLNKMKCYSDSPKYRHLEKREVLEQAIEKREYPFSKRDFKIEIIDFDTNKIIPNQMKNMKNMFNHLIYN